MIKGRLCDLYARYGRALIGVTFRSERSGFVYILTGADKVDRDEDVFRVEAEEEDDDLNYVSATLFVTLICFGTRVRNAAILLGWLRNKR